MANHGKRAPLARMAAGDGILIYSPTTTYPAGERLRTITFVGEVTGKEPEPSDVIAGGYRRAARLREIDPLPLAQVREHLPASRLRFSFFELDAVDNRGHPGRMCHPDAADKSPHEDPSAEVVSCMIGS